MRSYSYESFYSDTNNPKVRDLLEKYLKNNKKFPGFHVKKKWKVLTSLGSKNILVKWGI